MEFWYPKGAGARYPLVVFSHGAFGMKSSNTSTFMDLASNGYVVCSIDHPYHSLYTMGADGHVVMNDTVYPVPILTIFADDLVRLIAAIPDANTVVAVKHVTATAPNAYAVYLAGTDHMSLTDVPLVSPLLVSTINSSVPKGGGIEVDKYATIEKMNATVLEFFDVFLKGKGSIAAATPN